MTLGRTRLAFTAVLALVSLALPANAAAKKSDRDRDGMADRWERKNGLNPKKDDARSDRDTDGLRNATEFLSKTDPRRADSDRDGVADGDEDVDRDHVDNWNEQRESTHPRKKDSDRDGVRDGREDADDDGLDNHGEDATGNDPIDSDTDDDGIADGQEDAGVVESFENGVLVIELFGGGTISGLVVEGTEIECESEDRLEDGGLTEADEVEAAFEDEDFAEELDEDELVARGDRRVAVQDDGSKPGKGGKDDRDDEDVSEDEDASDSGDDSLEDEEPVEDEEPCGVDALVRGALVHEAELELVRGRAVFDEIELVR